MEDRQAGDAKIVRRGRGRPSKAIVEARKEHAVQLKEAGYGRAAERVAENGKLTVASTRDRLDKVLEFCRLSPEMELAKMAQDPNIAVEDRIKILTWFGNKRTPDLKSIDIQAEVKKDIQIVLKSFAGTMDVTELARPVLEEEME